MFPPFVLPLLPIILNNKLPYSPTKFKTLKTLRIYFFFFLNPNTDKFFKGRKIPIFYLYRNKVRYIRTRMTTLTSFLKAERARVGPIMKIAHLRLSNAAAVVCRPATVINLFTPYTSCIPSTHPALRSTKLFDANI